MATIVERKGRFTAQIRLRGFKSTARTFSTRTQAEQWAEQAEALMMAEIEARPADVNDVTERAYESCGVYFLYKGSECVYVGQSLNIHRRIQDHRKRLDFDVYSWTPVAPAQLPMVEQMYISTLNPRHNLMHRDRSRAG